MTAQDNSSTRPNWQVHGNRIVINPYLRDEEIAAIAKRMDAADDLLAALEFVVRVYGDDWSDNPAPMEAGHDVEEWTVAQVVLTAIAKAKGGAA